RTVKCISMHHRRVIHMVYFNRVGTRHGGYHVRPRRSHRDPPTRLCAVSNRATTWGAARERFPMIGRAMATPMTHGWPSLLTAPFRREGAGHRLVATVGP